jgi:predicted permease
MPAPPRDIPEDSRLFRLLVRLLPLEFRTDFGGEMLEVFGDERREARRRGRLGVLRVWLRTIAGICRTAAAQHADGMRLDLWQAVRALRATPALSLIALLSLALGIGANTAIFGFLNTLFVRVPAGVSAPEALVGVHLRDDTRILGESLTREQFDALRGGTRALSGVAAHTSVWVWLAGSRDPIELPAGAVSPGYFTLLGARPALGRLIEPADEAREPVVVLSHETWQAQFGGDPTVLGRRVSLNQQPFTIVGVTAPDFGGLYQGTMRAGLWVPTGVYGRWTAGSDYDLVGRLAPGRTVDDAQAELSVLLPTASPAPPQADDDEATRSLAVLPIDGVHPAGRTELTRAPLLLGAVVIVLLVIACANLAGLLLARSASRRHEMAVRVSLGATRGRLVRQLVTESLLLSVIGGAAGLLVAAWGGRLIETHFAYVFDHLRIPFDGRVLAFTGGATIASALGFGLAPALALSRAPFSTLRDGRSGRARGAPWRTSLLVGQVALSVALLVGAMLMVQSLVHLVGRPGYAQDDVAHYRLRPSRNRYDADRATAYYRAIVARIGQLPGVRSVTFASNPPVRGWGQTGPVSRPDGADRQAVESLRNDVSPGFFRALDMPLLHGREFDVSDRPGSPPVAIVTQSLARRLWGDADPIGRQIVFDGTTNTVVGIARDVHAGQAGEAPLACVYFPHVQQRAVDARLFVRTRGDAAAMVPVLRRELVAVDPQVHVGQEMTLRQRTARSFELERLTTQVLTGAGGVALTLTVIGLYGILSFWVGQRTREIGVRMSLGADASAILRLVVRQGMVPVGIGLAGGAVLTFVSTRALQTLVYGVSTHDPLTLTGTGLLVAAVALAACGVPARRAIRVDPVTALRPD